MKESRQLKEYRRIEEKRILLDPNKRHEYIRREREKDNTKEKCEHYVKEVIINKKFICKKTEVTSVFFIEYLNFNCKSTYETNKDPLPIKSVEDFLLIELFFVIIRMKKGI